jgi:hypothetical protein
MRNGEVTVGEVEVTFLRVITSDALERTSRPPGHRARQAHPCP